MCRSHFIIPTFLLFCLTSCQNQSSITHLLGLDSTTKYKISDDVSYLVLGADATEKKLQDIADEFKCKQDIDIVFEGTKYDSEGYVVSLNLKVSTQEGGGMLSSAPVNAAGFVVEKNHFRISSDLSNIF